MRGYVHAIYHYVYGDTKVQNIMKELQNSVAPEPEGSSPHSQEPTNDPYSQPGESTPPQPISLRSILIPSSHLHLGLSSGLFPFSLSHQNPVHVSTLSHACHMPCPPHSPWFDLPNNIWWWVQIMKLPTVQLSLFSCYFIPLRSKYSPQHPVLKHPQSVPFP
jgi:hypothetical protein